MAIPNNIPGDGELVEFELEEEPRWVTVKLKDGSIIQIKMEIVSIMKMGNDVNTGLPIYMVQATNIIRPTKVPKELIKRGNLSQNKSTEMYR